jgi:pyridoxamine 5'-phosphate oxidase family protein
MPRGRLATASQGGQPDVSAVGFSVEGDTIVSGGLDLSRTIRYRHLRSNPRATLVVDDLASVDPWRPRGVKVRGQATVEHTAGVPRAIRIRPDTVWSWGINRDAPKHFAGLIEKRQVSAAGSTGESGSGSPGRSGP